MAFTKIAAAGIGSTGTVTLENLVVTGSVTGAVTGNATGLSGTPNITVGTIGATSLNASGVVTATTFSGALTGNVTGNATGLSGTPNITVGSIIASNATISGNVSVAGTLTYEDVTNVDSIGIVTARTGVRIDAGGLVVVGVTTVAAGSVSAPSITPTGDSNTGIFFPSADTIAIAEGGSEALRIDSSGNIGIGTNNPGAKLDVAGSAQFGSNVVDTTIIQKVFSPDHVAANRGAKIRIGLNDGGFSGVEVQNTVGSNGSHNSQNVHLINHNGGVAGDIYSLTARYDGNIGIGITNPSEKTHISGTGDIKLRVGTTSSGVNANAALNLTTASEGNYVIQTGNAVSGGLRFYDTTAGAERVRVSAAGSFGIGTGNPDEILCVSKNSPDPYNTVLTHLKLINGAGNEGAGNRIQFATGAATAWIQSLVSGPNSTSGSDLVFGTPSTGTVGTERLRITSSGNVGIGLTNPSAKLQIAGNVTVRTATAEMSSQSLEFSEGSSGNSYGVRIGHTANTSLAFERYDGGWSEVMRVVGNGSVGIGITNPIGLTTGSAQTLHLDGYSAVLRVGPYFSVSDRDNILLVANSTDTYLRSNNERFHIYNNQGDILFHGTNDTETVRMDSSGRVTMPYQPSAAWRISTNGSGVRSVTISKNIGNNASSTPAGNGSTQGSVGRFTALVAGAYLISLFVSGTGASSNALLSVYGAWTSATNNISVGSEVFDCRVTRPPEDGGGWAQVFYFNANDYWEIDWYRPGSGNAYIDSSQVVYITAHLLA